MNNELIRLLNDIPKISYNKSEYEYNGIIVPRVTEIISSCIHSDDLMGWANSLGFKHLSYKKTIKESSDIGTMCHENIDNFIESGYNSNYIFIGNNQKSKNAYCAFENWWNDINSCNTVEILMHEQQLVCKYFGGTLDGLYRINNKIYLVDYKTSNHITFRYCLQLAAYRYMLKDLYNIDIDGCIILQLFKNNISYNEYVLDFSDKSHLDYMNHCEETFLSLVYAFYNVYKAKSDYSKLGWGNSL